MILGFHGGSFVSLALFWCCYSVWLWTMFPTFKKHVAAEYASETWENRPQPHVVTTQERNYHHK
jgi:hypothetical protein